MLIRALAIILLLTFTYTEVKKHIDKSEKELSETNIKEEIVIESGDIIFRKEDNPISDFFLTIDKSPYSHIGIVSNTKDGLRVFHMEFSEQSDDLKIDTIKSFVNFSKKIAVYRYKEEINSKKLETILQEFEKNKPKFDYYFSLDNKDLYCTEFVNEVYLKLFGENLYSYLYDYYGIEGISINSILKSEKLEKRFDIELWH